MTIAEDLIIEGHEPVPVYEVYKNLKDDDLICDISYLCSAGEYILGHTNKSDYTDIIIMRREDL